MSFRHCCFGFRHSLCRPLKPPKTTLSASAIVILGLCLPVSAIAQTSVEPKSQDRLHYAQIRPPATPYPPSFRTEPDAESTSNSGPICRDLFSFYAKLVTDRTAVFVTSTREYQTLLDRARRYDELRREIRRLTHRRNRAPSSDRPLIQAQIQQAEQEQGQLGNPRELRQILATEQQRERGSFRGVHDARFSQWNEEAMPLARRLIKRC